MKNLLRLSIAATILLTSFYAMSASAALSPLSVGIAPPVQFPPSDFSVTGARVSLLWGKHRDMYGLDVGVLGNITEQDFVGVGISGLFNATHGTTRAIGLQAAGVTNINTNKTSVYGLQFAGGVNYNSASSMVAGVQAALLANWSPHTEIYGLQVGLYNKAQTVYGMQIGLVNSAQSLYGIQIGLVNFHDKGLFKVSPILNVGF